MCEPPQDKGEGASNFAFYKRIYEDSNSKFQDHEIQAQAIVVSKVGSNSRASVKIMMARQIHPSISPIIAL